MTLMLIASGNVTEGRVGLGVGFDELQENWR